MIDNMYDEHDEIVKIKLELEKLQESIKLLTKEIEILKRNTKKRFY